jgi:hypothetical protein
MGKRNKFSKIGICTRKYKSQLDVTKNKINSNTSRLNKTQMDLEMDGGIDDEKVELKPNLNHTVIDEDKLNRHSSILGIEKDHLRSFMLNPVRHRRPVTKIVLSKGQKKRLEKKEKFKRKEVLCEKIKLSNSMINITNNKTLNLSKTDIVNTVSLKKDQFNLLDINNTLGDLIDDIKENKEEVNLCVKSSTHRGKRNLNKLLNQEKEKIKKVIENKNYQSNPLEAMKFHIKNAQLIEERKKKIDENFQKNYNFLNLKK